MSNAANAEDLLEIAIIGMSCRFPGAPDVDAYWRNLKEGVESITFLSDSELLESHVDPSLLQDPSYVKAGGMLEDIEWFDASFFGFSPREASLMDPQHRLFLECAWEALEHAGYTPRSHNGAIGVYGGAAMNGYLLFNLATRPDVAPALFDFQIQIGNDKDYLTTRVSYKLNLKGPSINIQTACSTSLVAVHVACQSLLNGECNLALAGGISVSVPQKVGYLYREGGLHSSDGHCRAFDAQATGTVFGSGVGIVVLKRLADALADRDHIHAVIKGSAVNNDGSAKVGYTAPSVDGQAAVIAEALAVAGLDADSIGYVETHGTGTPMGDPIEVKALTQAFRETTERRGYCALGAVKTNLGHLDVAAGVAGLIKTALALEYGQIPPTLHFRTPNPEIDFENSLFFVNVGLADWKQGTRRAGVSSFGLGGTNAHVVLEEAPLVEASGPSRPWQLLLLSARTPTALDHMSERLAAHLESHPQQSIADIAFTLQTGREVFSQRRAVVCCDREGLIDSLRGRDRHAIATALDESRERSVVFMFPGQGAQYVGMGRDLYATEPAFREHVDRCAELLKGYLGVDLRALIYPPEGSGEKAAGLLQQTWITQPALFVIEYALARLWMEWGIRPQAMIGHSIGEYVAACLSGVMALADALQLVAARGRLMQDLPGGAMLAVALPEDALGDLSAAGLALAAVNAPSRCVLSGPGEAVERLAGRLTEQGHRCRRLHTSHAFHSDMMEPILDRFTTLVSTIALHPPQIPLISNLTGTWITPEEATDPGYYARHLRQTVRFAAGIGEVTREADRILLEVGPGRTLGSLVQQSLAERAAPLVLSSMRHPQQQDPDTAVLLTALGRLWLAGIPVDWPGFYARERRRRQALPTYPFERQRHWIEPGRQVAKERPVARPSARKLGIAEWFYLPSWQQAAAPGPRRTVDDAGCWLVFAGASGIGDRIARHLEKAKQDVVTVLPGDRAAWIGKQRYTLDPRQRADYDRLIEALNGIGKLPRNVIHAWNAEPGRSLDVDTEAFARSQDLGFNSLLFLAQALGGHNFSDSLRITVLSSGVHAVNGEEALYPERAPLLGACIVLSQEYPNLDCRNIDLVLPEPGSAADDVLVTQVLNEIGAATPEVIVAYRGAGRWVQAFRPARLEGSAGTPRRLRDQGVYLITGGLGAIGFALAEYLAGSIQARLVLTGRSPLPDRREWAQWLADHDAGDATRLRIRRVQSLEALGAEVLVISADVGDREQMQAALKRAEERFGRIDGVIHGAGIVAEEAFLAVQDTTRSDCERHFHPKAQGLLVLHELLQDRAPDFYLLLSSISSIVGGLGYAPYAAANLYLDAYAQQCARQSPGTWISVNWDAWLFETARAERHGMGSIVADLALSPEEGVEAFRRILSSDMGPQIVVSTTDLATRIEQWVKRKSRMGGDSAHKDAAPLSAAAAASVTDAVYDTEMQRVIAAIWREVLGVHRIETQDNFLDLGGDSLLLMDVIARLKSAYGIVLNPREIIFQTLGQLAAVCEERQSVKAGDQDQPRKGGLFDTIKRKMRRVDG